MHQIGSYYMTLNGVGPGIDISHYGSPYKGMFGLDGLGSYTEQPGEHFEYATAGLGRGMLYRYGAGLGVEPWTGAPAADPRMVKRFTTIRSTYNVRGLGGDWTAARAANVLLAKARALYPGNTVHRIGSTGWISGGRVGFEVILAQTTRAGEIKQKNYQAGQRAAAAMGGNVRFTDAQTTIPSSGFTEAAPDAPATPETTPSAPLTTTSDGNFLTQRVAGLPVWALGLIGLGVVGGIAVVLTRKKPAAVAANRRRRRRRRSRRPRRNSRRRRTTRRRRRRR